jgi:hypothetical protein
MSTNPSIEFTHRVTADCPYYIKYGQGGPHDGVLIAGSKVRQIRTQGSAMRILTAGQMNNRKGVFKPLASRAGGFTHVLEIEQAYYRRIVAAEPKAGALAAGSKLTILSAEEENPANVQVEADVSTSDVEPLEM